MTICGADCGICTIREKCGGCFETGGHPFGGECVIAKCCNKNGFKLCSECNESVCICKKQLIDEINALSIENMPQVNELYQLKGSFINIEYTLPSGERAKFLKDNNIYLGTQVNKNNSDRYCGISADENYILVSEYGKNGDDPQIVVFKKR